MDILTSNITEEELSQRHSILDEYREFCKSEQGRILDENSPIPRYIDNQQEKLFQNQLNNSNFRCEMGWKILGATDGIWRLIYNQESNEFIFIHNDNKPDESKTNDIREIEMNSMEKIHNISEIGRDDNNLLWICLYTRSVTWDYSIYTLWDINTGVVYQNILEKCFSKWSANLRFPYDWVRKVPKNLPLNFFEELQQ